MFTIKWLQNIFPEARNTDGLEKAEIKMVGTDSRARQKQGLFIPLKGASFDAHEFAEQAIANGAIALFWQRNRPVPDVVVEKAAVFLVEDTLSAMQHLAACYRNLVNPLVIGITGSNGKTTTKDLVASVFRQERRTHFTKGNLNNHIGVPLTILSMPPETETLIVEMGMNHFGEIEQLSNIAQPDYAVITNIGESHIEFLGSRAGIAKAKMEIISGLKDGGSLVIDADEPLLEPANDQAQTLSCGFGEESDIHIQYVKVGLDGTAFELADGATFNIPLYGRHHAKNAAYAIALAEKEGISRTSVQKGFDDLAMTGMRFEWLKGKHHAHVINDAYNASPTSMKAAIEVVKEIEGFRDKVLVLGDIFELGEQADALHRSVAENIEPPITVLFTLGEKAALISDETAKRCNDLEVKHFASQSELIQALEMYMHDESLILFKASRGMKFENMIEKVCLED